VPSRVQVINFQFLLLVDRCSRRLAATTCPRHFGCGSSCQVHEQSGAQFAFLKLEGPGTNFPKYESGNPKLPNFAAWLTETISLKGEQTKRERYTSIISYSTVRCRSNWNDTTFGLTDQPSIVLQLDHYFHT
jgi:hypothetical protein